MGKVQNNNVGGVDSGTDGFIFRKLTGGELEVYYEAGNVSKYATTDNAIIADGSTDWHHLVTVVDDTANQIYIYLDGVNQTLDSTNDGDISGITNSSYNNDTYIYAGAKIQTEGLRQIL